MTATLTKAPVQTHTMSIGNCWVAEKGFSQEDFEKEVTPQLLAELREEMEHRFNDYGRKEMRYAGEEALTHDLAEMALAQGKLKVGYFGLSHPEPVDEHNGEDVYQYDYSLEFEVAFV